MGQDTVMLGGFSCMRRGDYNTGKNEAKRKIYI